MALGFGDQLRHHARSRREEVGAEFLEPQSQVGRDLIGARSARVHALGEVAAALAEFAFDVAVNVLGGVVVGHAVRSHVREKVVDRLVHRNDVLWLQHACACERSAPCTVRLEVREHEVAIDGQALLEVREERVQFALEPSTPHLARLAHCLWPSPVPCTRATTAPGRP